MNIIFSLTDLGLHEISDSTIRNLWEIDSIGIKSDEANSGSLGDPVLIHFSENIKFVNGCYKIALPFNDKKNQLLSNKVLASIRLKMLHKGLRAKPILCQAYDGIFKE